MINNLALKSFFMGGFECADHINRAGVRINLQKENLHDQKILEDYKALHDIGIYVVREGICWSEVETQPYEFDFTRLLEFLEVAEQLNMQIIWDLCHFGYPDDLSPTHPQFSIRFAALCREFTLFHCQNSKHIPWIVPINEISFLSWHSGDMRGTVPFAINSGWDIKYHLCKAAIAGIKNIKTVLPEAVVLLVEPLVKVHPDNGNLNSDQALKMHNYQFEAMDIILGRSHPELEGDSTLIDVLGFNYYYNNQWTENNITLSWPDREGKMTPLSQLLLTAFERYNYPIILTETGHFGTLKADWLQEIIIECDKAIQQGVDLRGICIYPVIDRPDWDDLTSYCKCGLWDLDKEFNRIPHQRSIGLIMKAPSYFNFSFVDL